MFDLSLTKLLIILVVGVLLAGPARLPALARQAAGIRRRLTDARSALDREVRATMPDLPASRDLVRYARSPAALLDRLARMDTPGGQLTGEPAAGGPASGTPTAVEPGAQVTRAQPTFVATSVTTTTDHLPR